MTSTLAARKAELVDRIAAEVAARVHGATGEVAAAFARRYFMHVAPEDLLDDDAENLAGAVLSHWSFARQRKPGTAAIRVINPSYDEHGWSSTHTVLEIVCDDMPFLVDSVTMALNRSGLTVQRLFHPMMPLRRDAEGVLEALLDAPEQGAAQGVQPGALRESVMHFEFDRQTDPQVLDDLEADVAGVLRDVRAAVEDWKPMRARLLEIAEGDDIANAPISPAERDEARAFLRWMADDHFAFIGYRCYDIERGDIDLTLCALAASGLGILRDTGGPPSRRSFSSLPAEQRAFALGPMALIVNKASAISTIHRPTRLDYLGVKRFDSQGQVIGEHRFLGLHSSAAYSALPKDIPLLRTKVRAILERAGLPANSHGGKALQHILDGYPRDELFQASEEELFEIATGIMHLEERRRLRIFTRNDTFGRFVTCLIFIPRERYTTDMRLRMQEILFKALNGTSAEFITRFSDSVLARVRMTIYIGPGGVPEYSVPEIEARLREALLSWDEKLVQALIAQCGEERGNALARRYENALGPAYQADFAPRAAVGDIVRLDEVAASGALQLHLYRHVEDPESMLRFKVYGPDQTIALADMLPLLENMGLRVLAARPYEILTREGHQLWMLEFDLNEAPGVSVDAGEIRDIFQDAMLRVWAGGLENDGFNRLVIAARMDWRDVVVLRAYCKYLLQTQMPFSQAYVEKVLVENAPISANLVALFHARFDPDRRDGAAEAETRLVVEIEEALERVVSLDDDRILRRFLAVVRATLRTNFYQTDAQDGPKEYLSFKFDPHQIPELPLPRPMYEIFVYSPRVEAVHLRGGPVARGGLRWSDRKEDFRTEVLGLMKAQMVKNSVIVPVGSKGGFVVKRMPEAREAVQEEVVHCYKSLIRGMLDLTDNRVGGEIVGPPRVVRHDGEDPYLVVAADKGTASFSDIANGVSQEYGFWLGDAFASGGSAGYDHKKMGITARGAWESVMRHFRELGMDIQNRDAFSVVGVGDMSGDVFGNGMLLSPHIRLVAAFDHRHVFLDPDPDTQTSNAERARLFALPRSSWADYDAGLISKGGGVYPRTLKSIPISPEVRRVLDISVESLTPVALIRAILKAPADLLWNGGIGTYVKAHTESHAEAGDRANDAVRIDGRELRVRVVGEGGNLGLTQRGRIEAAANGVRLLTDAIDNSGGVNCSDHEVNIKILLEQAVRAGDLTLKQRDVLLAQMTDEVAGLVLRENYRQPQAIAMALASAGESLGEHAAMIRALEKAGKLDRVIEFLPDEEELRARETGGKGLTAPELAVLLAYGKITLFEQLVASDAPEDPHLRKDLFAYFPKRLQEAFAPLMETHPLRRQIICTYVVNSMLDRMGPSFAFRMRDDTGEDAPAVARAYAVAREVFDAPQLWVDLQSLDNRVASSLQLELLVRTQELLERATLWLLRNRRQPLAIDATVQQFREGMAAIVAEPAALLAPSDRAEIEATAARYGEAGVPATLATRIAIFDWLYCALDIIEAAQQADIPEPVVARVYFGIFNRLDLGWLRGAILAIPAAGAWQHRARAALLDGLYGQARALTAHALPHGVEGGAGAIDAWAEANREGLSRYAATLTELRAVERPDLAMLSVALREIGSLMRSR